MSPSLRGPRLRPILSLFACVAACLIGGVATATAASPTQTLGVYAGAGQPAAVADFELRTGHPAAVVEDYLARDSWASIDSPDWWTSVWGATVYRSRMLFTVPMLPDTGGSLASGAAGKYNSYFVTLARKLVAGGQAGAILRLGPEFNGNWFKWTIAVPNGAANYAAYWRRIVTAMRSVPGAAFRFDWTANGGSSWYNGAPLNAAAAYPGDAYVNYVGLDQYDMSWIANHTDPTARWNSFLTQPYGLQWQQQFAAAHSKQMTFPEWGLAQRTDGYGGGDDPAFISSMYNWIQANNVAYSVYFNYADSVTDSRLFTGLFPNASTLFLQLF